jgi:hypothetical protein
MPGRLRHDVPGAGARHVEAIRAGGEWFTYGPQRRGDMIANVAAVNAA